MIHDELLFTIILSLSGVQFIGGKAALDLCWLLYSGEFPQNPLCREHKTPAQCPKATDSSSASLSPVRPGPGRLCFHGRAGSGLTAQSAQAIIRLFQGYAVIME